MRRRLRCRRFLRRRTHGRRCRWFGNRRGGRSNLWRCGGGNAFRRLRSWGLRQYRCRGLGPCDSHRRRRGGGLRRSLRGGILRRRGWQVGECRRGRFARRRADHRLRRRNGLGCRHLLGLRGPRSRLVGICANRNNTERNDKRCDDLWGASSIDGRRRNFTQIVHHHSRLLVSFTPGIRARRHSVAEGTKQGRIVAIT